MTWWWWVYLTIAGICPFVYLVGLARVLDRSVTDVIKESLEVPLVFLMILGLATASLFWVVVIPSVLVLVALVSMVNKGRRT